MKRHLRAVIVTTLAVVAAAPAVAQPPAHPMIPPFPGARVPAPVDVKMFDEYEMLTGPLKDRKMTKSEQLEGKVATFWYTMPSERSVLEVFRNYEAALASAGFATIFTCKGREQCGPQMPLKGLGYMPGGDEARYLVGKKTRPEGDVYVAMHINPTASHFVVVETKAMETGLVKITADALGTDILRDGHVAVYDLLFDTGKADLKPESTAALEQIAALLTKSAAMKLHVVGHTDNVGTLDANLDLSRRRAAAVVSALTARHGIAAARLRADGVGPLAPVASNDTDQGRGKNRRVELVKQ